MQAAIARFNAERCLEVLWVPGHCGLQDNELADEESKLGSAEHQPPVRLDCATRTAVIRRACSTLFISTSLHAATYPSNLVLRENPKMSKPERTQLRRFRSGHHRALRRWQHLINRSEEASCRICNDEDETYDHLWLRCPASGVFGDSTTTTTATTTATDNGHSHPLFQCDKYFCDNESSLVHISCYVPYHAHDAVFYDDNT